MSNKHQVDLKQVGDQTQLLKNLENVDILQSITRLISKHQTNIQGNAGRELDGPAE